MKTTLSEAQQKWLIKHFKHTKNDDVAARLGVSQRTAIRLARALGLKKTKQFMTKCQRATADAAKASHLRNRTYPKKGTKIPRSEEFWFKVGESPLQRLGARREALRVQKSAESRRKTWKREKARATFGLPQQTKLRVIPVPKQKIQMRHYLKKRGYILDEVKRIAYYDENTLRGKRIEAKPQRWYKFEQKPTRIDENNLS